MLNWISEKILDIVSLMPAWLVERDSLNFLLIRAMFALLFVVFLIWVFAFWPSRANIARLIHKLFPHRAK
jgi:hypothetical protein